MYSELFHTWWRLRGFSGFCYTRGPIWPFHLLLSLISLSPLFLEREEEEGRRRKEKESLLRAWSITFTLSSSFWWVGACFWSFVVDRSSTLEDLELGLKLLRRSFAYLPLCSFAHACKGRSLQAGTPEIAIATHIRRAGLGAEVDCRGPGSFLGAFGTGGGTGSRQGDRLAS
uniref:Uncharacterized protein n=1 Tax=Ananas comosus var. bracteatus TaxID=296719 RepID=A0A6V7P1R2_ANACO|nr:unnamed protein product [Ananas comosus var. bracteatus]